MAIEGDLVPFNLLPAGGGEGVPSSDLGANYVQVTDQYGVPVSGASVIFSADPGTAVTLKSCTAPDCPNAEPACSPASGASVTCATDQYGFAYIDVVAGSSATPACVTSGNCPVVNYTVSCSGCSGSFSYNIQGAPNVTSISDSAAGKSPVAPGSYVSIYGTGLSDYTDLNVGGAYDALASNGEYIVLPLQIDFLSVSVDVPSAGISLPAPLTYVSPTQVNIQMPWELQGQTSAQIKVIIDGDLLGNVVTVPIANYNPQMFTYGSDVAIAQDNNYNLITTSNPAKRGSPFIILYCNGLGPVTNQPATAFPALGTSTTTQPVTVSFGGVAGNVIFAGLTPGLSGLYQIDVAIPTSVTAGSAVPVTVSVGGVTSAQATLPIQ
jgi:uncharacterized protein (TIGR03437 family)